jgi:two-component system, sensor histidine kinase PdtaS
VVATVKNAYGNFCHVNIITFIFATPRKNNFDTVIRLLGTQSTYLKSEEALVAMEDSQHRIHAMSLIHQKLYQSENFSVINMPDYIYKLVEYLKGCFETSKTVRFQLQIERIDLDVSHALPLALILNEAITNSIKYAFHETSEERITISLHRIPKNNLCLAISHNGVGLSNDFNLERPGSIGWSLIKRLADDIGGMLLVERNEGRNITISFPYNTEKSHNFRSVTLGQTTT